MRAWGSPLNRAAEDSFPVRKFFVGHKESFIGCANRSGLWSTVRRSFKIASKIGDDSFGSQSGFLRRGCYTIPREIRCVAGGLTNDASIRGPVRSRIRPFARTGTIFQVNPGTAFVGIQAIQPFDRKSSHRETGIEILEGSDSRDSITVAVLHGIDSERAEVTCIPENGGDFETSLDRDLPIE